MTPVSPRATPASRITATTALAACLALFLPGTAFAEMGQVRTESREVIITEEGVYEVGEDVESLEVFLRENPEYVPAVEHPDGIGTLATTSLPLTHGTLTTRTTNCDSATVRYHKTSGSRLSIRFSVAQVGRLTQTGGTTSIVAGQSRSYSVSLRPVGNVQGRMYVIQQGTTFTNNYISCR